MKLSRFGEVIKFNKFRKIQAGFALLFVIALSNGCGSGGSDIAAADRVFAEANRLYQEGDFAGARVKLLDLLVQFPENPRLHNNLGNVLVKEGLFDEAREHYQRALGFSPGYVVARVNLAMLSLMNQETEAAFAMLSQIQSDYPDHADVHNGLGVCELRRGNVSSAVNHFRKAIDIKDGHPMLYNNLAYAYAESNEYLNEAQKLVKEAIKDDPENPVLLDTQGWVLFKRGVFEEAIEQLNAALAEDPDSKTIRSHLVNVYRWLGQEERAVEIISEGIRLKAMSGK
jgi:Flp pilus assembly protein TadD